MKKVIICTYMVLVLALALEACRQPNPEPQLAPPKSRPVFSENPIEKDPAAFLEGVYTGDIYTRTSTRIGLLGPGTNLLIKRLSTHQVELHSIYGQMQSYQLTIALERDTIQAIAKEPLALAMVVKMVHPLISMSVVLIH